MPHGAYAKPPITEAVIDIQIDTALSGQDIQKLKARFGRHYPHPEELVDWNFGFGPDASGAMRTQMNETGRWYKLTSDDQVEIVLIKPQNLTTARLSPYNGWLAFFDRAKENYQTWRSVVGYKKVTRIATRYINRLDIPLDDLATNGVQAYFTTVPNHPGSRLFSDFLIQGVVAVPEIDARANFIFATVHSPIIDHKSFVLDIDLYRDHEIPTRREDLWEMIGTFRRYKNTIFEDSITDRARALFDVG